jgi:PAS domain S-box-containing protein
MRLMPFVKFRTKRAAILDASAVAAASGADCVMVIDGHTGRIERADAAAHRMFGWPEEALIGTHINGLIPQARRTLHDAERVLYMLHPITKPMGPQRKVMVRHANGELFEIEAGLSPMSGRRIVFVCHRVVTREGRYE